MTLFWQLVLLLLSLATSSVLSTDSAINLKSLMEQLTLSIPPLSITRIGKLSRSHAFFANFVHKEAPLLMQSALSGGHHPGLRKWTDGFFRSNYGHETVTVESSRIERRGQPRLSLTFNQFLGRYHTEDLYMVHSLIKNMQDLALIPETLQCGGFQRTLQDVVLWMGSGEASSVLHKDPLDNLLCVLDGHKDVVLISKTLKNSVERHGFNHEGSYSYIDQTNVDLSKYPGLQNIDWHLVKLDQGDCVFIPNGWYHQVTSSGWRHLSVNIWFSHLQWFNRSDCPDDESRYPLFEPVSSFGLASPNEIYRSELLASFKGKIVTRYQIHEHTQASVDRSKQFFDVLDTSKDGALSWGELYEFDIDRAIVDFPDIFGLFKKMPHKSENGQLSKDDGTPDVQIGDGVPMNIENNIPEDTVERDLSDEEKDETLSVSFTGKEEL